MLNLTFKFASLISASSGARRRRLLGGRDAMNRYVCSGGRLAILSAVVGLGPGHTDPQGPPRAPQSIFGIYGQTSAGRDSIRITDKPDGKIGVAIRLYFSGGHTCQLNKDGEWREDHLSVIAEGLDASRPCRLNGFFGNGRILLKDDAYQCAPVYCGTRGKLDNVSLPKMSAKPK